jgi:hypothetical protein
MVITSLFGSDWHLLSNSKYNKQAYSIVQFEKLWFFPLYIGWAVSYIVSWVDETP